MEVPKWVTEDPERYGYGRVEEDTGKVAVLRYDDAGNCIERREVSAEEAERIAGAAS